MLARAQVSLEFLLVFLAFLAFLTVWIPIQLEIAEDAKLAIKAKQLQLALADIKAAADAVCLLGKNNVKTIEVNAPASALAAKNDTITITLASQEKKENKQFKEQTNCLLKQKTIQLNGKTKIRIENTNGTIKIS